MTFWVPSRGRRRSPPIVRRSEAAPGTQEGVRPRQVMIGMINSATMLATLIIGLMAGPAVSL